MNIPSKEREGRGSGKGRTAFLFLGEISRGDEMLAAWIWRVQQEAQDNKRAAPLHQKLHVTVAE